MGFPRQATNCYLSTKSLVEGELFPLMTSPVMVLECLVLVALGEKVNLGHTTLKLGILRRDVATDF